MATTGSTISITGPKANSEKADDGRGTVRATSPVRATAQIVLPFLLGALFVVLTYDPGYKIFLADETRFVEAISAVRPAFFLGYIGFLGFAAFLSWLFAVPVGLALHLESSLLAGVAVSFFCLWLARMGLRWWQIALGTAAFASNSFLLYYASVGLTYCAEAAGFMAVGYFLLARERPRLSAAAIALAVLGALRQSACGFLAPLFFWLCWRERKTAPALIFAALCIPWLWATVYLSGGVDAYLHGGSEHFGGVILSHTFQAPQYYALNFSKAIVYVVYGIHVLLPLGVIGLKDRPRREVTLWILPTAAFFILVFVAIPGYTLGLSSAIIVLGVVETVRLRKAVAVALLAGAISINLAQFFLLAPPSRPRGLVEAYATVEALQYTRQGLRSEMQARLADLLASQR